MPQHYVVLFMYLSMPALHLYRELSSMPALIKITINYNTIIIQLLKLLLLVLFLNKSGINYNCSKIAQCHHCHQYLVTVQCYIFSCEGLDSKVFNFFNSVLKDILPINKKNNGIKHKSC